MEAAATLREGVIDERECQPHRRSGQKQKRSHSLLHYFGSLTPKRAMMWIRHFMPAISPAFDLGQRNCGRLLCEKTCFPCNSVENAGDAEEKPVNAGDLSGP